MSLAGAEEISLNGAVAAVSSEFHGIFTLKKEQRMPLKAFLGGKDAFALPLAHNITAHHSLPQGSDMGLMSLLLGSLKRLLPV